MLCKPMTTVCTMVTLKDSRLDALFSVPNVSNAAASRALNNWPVHRICLMPKLFRQHLPTVWTIHDFHFFNSYQTCSKIEKRGSSCEETI